MSGSRLLNRANDSAEVWSWAFNFFRLASGLLLLPLLLRILGPNDLGIYYVLLSLASLVPLLDNACSYNIARFVGYAMGGATDIRPQGMEPNAPDAPPNHRLVGELLQAARAMYLRLAAVTTLLLGVTAFLVVRIRVAETDEPRWTWIATGLTVLSAGTEVYSNWWNAFLRGMNAVRDGARTATIAYGAKLILACSLLLAGCGLAAVPVAAICAALLQRTLSRNRVMALLPESGEFSAQASAGKLMSNLWPNSWRVGLQLLSGYVALNGLNLLCLQFLGLQANARLGLSWQITSIIQGMAGVWTQVAWPRVSQLRTQGDAPGIIRLLRPRLWKQQITYLAMAAGVALVGQDVLALIAPHKQLLAPSLLTLLLLNGFLEMNFSFWTVLLTTENHVPSLRATIATNLTGLAVAAGMIGLSPAGLPSLVIGPLVTGACFNYWYWPWRGARSLNTTWLRFLTRN